MFRRAAVVLGVLGVLSLPAHAQPGRTPPGDPNVPPPATYVPPPSYAPPPATMRTDRYGTTIAGVDALAAGLVVLGMVVLVGSLVDGDSGGEGDGAGLGAAMMIGGVGVYAFGPAFVHTRHKNNRGAWMSVGLRLGLPMLGGMLGAAMDSGETCDASGCYDDGGDEAASSLAGLGMLGAMVIDWAVLAKVRVPVAQPQYYPYAAPIAGGGGGTIGLAGAF